MIGSIAPRGDQRLRRLVDAPFLAERRGLVEDVLAVVQIQRRVSNGVLGVVAGRQVDDDGAVVLEDISSETRRGSGCRP